MSNQSGTNTNTNQNNNQGQGVAVADGSGQHKRHGKRVGRVFGDDQTGKHAKVGPTPDDFLNYKTVDDKPTLFQMLADTKSLKGGNDFRVNYLVFGNDGVDDDLEAAGENCSVEMVMTKHGSKTMSRNTSVEHVRLNWRVSLACANHIVEVQYVKDTTGVGTLFKWGAYQDLAAILNDLRSKYTGSRRTAGNQVTHYNANEQMIQTTAVIKQYGVMEGAKCHSVHLWHRVFYNLLQIRIVQEEGLFDDDHGATWVNRPDNPAYVQMNMWALNTFLANVNNVMAGDQVIIEISTAELLYVPYIIFLLGAGPETWRYNFPVRADGHRLVPHLKSKIPSPINFGFLVYDDLNSNEAVYAQLELNCALPGLNQGELATGQPVGEFDEHLIGGALGILAAAVPFPGDIEAGALLAAVGMFAENFNGVGKGSVIGKSERHKNYCALLHEGRVSIPGGSLACCILTRLAGREVQARLAKERMIDVQRSFSDLSAVRAAVECHAMAVQMGCRQYGLDVGVMFCRVNPNNIYPNMPALTHHRTSADVLTEAHEQEGNCPPPIGVMTSLMCEALYGCVLTVSSMHLRAGNFSIRASPPRYRSYIPGECLCSVHAAQLDSDILMEAAQGLAGMPHGLGKIAEEFQMFFNGTGYSVKGTPGHKIKGTQVELNPGVNMAGHTATLMYDEYGEAGEYILQVTPIAEEGIVAATKEVAMGYPHVSAFVQDTFDEDWSVELQMPILLCDYDSRALANLSVTASQHVAHNYYNVERNRYALPGYVEATIQSGIKQMSGNFGLSVVRRSVKRSLEP